MRVMMHVTMPTGTFNACVKDGTAGSKLNRCVEEMNPEAVYFTERDGLRTAVIITELEDPSKVPVLAEPWFLTFDAKVEFNVCMSPEDLGAAGLDEIGKKYAE